MLQLTFKFFKVWAAIDKRIVLHYSEKQFGNSFNMEDTMSINEVRAKIKGSVWQAIAKSGVDVSALPKAQADKLVNAITEGVLQEVDELLDQAGGKPGSAAAVKSDAGDDDEEQILWEGRPFLSLRVRYQITDERVRIIEGLLGKEYRDVELVRIQDIDHKQNLAERTFNIGDVFIHSHDVTDPEIVLNNVTNPKEVHEIVRRAVLNARKKHNMSYREEM